MKYQKIINFKQQIRGQSGNAGTKSVSGWNVFRHRLQLKWSKDCILVDGIAGNQNPKLEKTDTNSMFLL